MTALQRLRAAAAAARLAWNGQTPQPAVINVPAPAPPPAMPDMAALRQQVDALTASAASITVAAGKLQAALDAAARR